MKLESGTGALAQTTPGGSIVLLLEEDRAIALQTDATGTATLLGWGRIKAGKGLGGIVPPARIAEACRGAIGHERRVDAHVGLPMSWVQHTVIEESLPGGERKRLERLSRVVVENDPERRSSEEDVLFPEGAGRAGGRRRPVLISTSGARVNALVAELARRKVHVRGASSGVGAVAGRIAEIYEHHSGSHALILRSDGFAVAEFDESGVVSVEFVPKSIPQDPKGAARAVAHEIDRLRGDDPGQGNIVVTGRSPKRRDLFISTLLGLTGDRVAIRHLGDGGDWLLQAEALVADADEGDERQLLPVEVTARRGRWIPKAAAAALLVAGAIVLGSSGADRADGMIDQVRERADQAKVMRSGAGAIRDQRTALLSRLGKFAGYRETMEDLASGRRNPADLLMEVAKELPPEARLKVFESAQPLVGAASLSIRGEFHGEAAFAPLLVESLQDRLLANFGADDADHAVADEAQAHVVPFVLRMKLPRVAGDEGIGTLAEEEPAPIEKPQRRPRGFGNPRPTHRVEGVGPVRAKKDSK